jgi:Ethanolamine utilization protein EutJ (predicted chaperonin)
MYSNGSIDMKVEVKERKKTERKQKKDLAPVVQPIKVGVASISYRHFRLCHQLDASNCTNRWSIQQQKKRQQPINV